jgi:hypothetical protein
LRRPTRQFKLRLKQESDMSVITLMTSFLDGVTGERIFGDLRIPRVPDRLFEDEPEDVQPAEKGGEINE